MGLIEEIEKNESIRTLFGKQELIIIKKQLLGVKLKPSERTRLSRDIRKKLRAIISLHQFREEFNLKPGGEIKMIIEDTKELILNSSYQKNIKKIILFGSQVKKEATLLSDIDIAVEFFNISQKDASRFKLEIIRKINPKVDIQVYNSLDNKIKVQIDKHGKTIYQTEN